MRTQSPERRILRALDRVIAIGHSAIIRFAPVGGRIAAVTGHVDARPGICLFGASWYCMPDLR